MQFLPQTCRMLERKGAMVPETNPPEGTLKVVMMTTDRRGPVEVYFTRDRLEHVASVMKITIDEVLRRLRAGQEVRTTRIIYQPIKQ